jgi:hypothetical protein
MTRDTCERCLETTHLSRLGESNPRPTHYEKPAKALRARYLHRLQHTRPGMLPAHRMFRTPGPQRRPVLSNRVLREGPDGTHARPSNRRATHRSYRAVPNTRACADKDMCTRITPSRCGWGLLEAGGGRTQIIPLRTAIPDHLPLRSRPDRPGLSPEVGAWQAQRNDGMSSWAGRGNSSPVRLTPREPAPSRLGRDRFCRR